MKDDEFKIKVSARVKQATDEMIAKVEAATGLRLPADYIQFLKRSNGGVPKPNEFRFICLKGRTETGKISEFLHIGTGPSAVEELHLLTRKHNALPSNFLQIAEDLFGDRICLNLGKVNYGAVCLYPDDLGVLKFDKEGVPLESLATTVAPSFAQFINDLQEIDK